MGARSLQARVPWMYWLATKIEEERMKSMHCLRSTLRTCAARHDNMRWSVDQERYKRHANSTMGATAEPRE